MSMKYSYILFVVFMSVDVESSQQQSELIPNDHIVVHNQTDKIVYLLIYNIDKSRAYPTGIISQVGKVAPRLLASQSKTTLLRADRKKLSRFTSERQKLVVSVYSALLGYTMSPEGLECFPVLSMSGFRSKRKTNFYITAALLESQQFGKLTMDSYQDDILRGDCYARLSDAIDEARTH